MSNGLIKLGLTVLFGVLIGVGPGGCKKTEDYYNRGISRLNKREHDGAISDFTKAIEANPRFAMAYFYRGRAYQGKQEYDLALSDFTDSIKLNPGLSVAYSDRAIIYFHKKQYDKVWDDIGKAESLGLETRPGFLKALREASGRQK